MKNEKISIPIEFSKIKEYETKDERFTEVLIKILHLGRNFNASIFNKEVVDKALPTLANTPILCYIEKNKDNEDDFSDHRYVLEKEDGELKMVYKGQAIGVIPESFAKDAYYKDCICSDGLSRTFLFCKALIWNKIDKAIEILEKKDGTEQSMELSDNYTGHMTNDGFVFDSFEFYGCCAINIQPAMIDSRIEINFSANDIANEIKNKLEQFKTLFNKTNKEGEEIDMAKNNKDVKDEVIEEEIKDNACSKDDKKDNEKSNVKDNACGDKKKDNEEVVDDEKSEIKDDNNKDSQDKDFEDVKDDNDDVKDIEDDKDDIDEDDIDKDDDKEDMKCKKYSINFELSFDDIIGKLYEKLYEIEKINNTCYGIQKVYENYFIYFDYCNGQYFKQSYSKSNDEISFEGERIEVFSLFVDEATKNEIEAKSYSKLKEELNIANGKIEVFSKENSELKEFKAKKDEECRIASIDNEINKFSKYKDTIDLESFKTKAYSNEIKVEDIENLIFAEIGKKNFSLSQVGDKIEEKSNVNFKMSLKDEKDECPYPSLKAFFK